MKNQKALSRRRTSHRGHAAPAEPHWATSISVEGSGEAEVDAADGDSVPQPIEEWSDDDDANRWLHEHRFDGGEQFDLN
jgi:hypothetical protein